MSIKRELRNIERELGEIERDDREILHDLERHTPTRITFKEITMLPTEAGNTLVYTGTPQPAGSSFPSGTSFNVVSNDPAVIPAVDATGLIVTVPLPLGWVENTTTPLAITYTASGITPVPASGPTEVTATITPSVEAVTPTGIAFVQTT